MVRALHVVFVNPRALKPLVGLVVLFDVTLKVVKAFEPLASTETAIVEPVDELVLVVIEFRGPAYSVTVL